MHSKGTTKQGVPSITYMFDLASELPVTGCSTENLLFVENRRFSVKNPVTGSSEATTDWLRIVS